LRWSIWQETGGLSTNTGSGAVQENGVDGGDERVGRHEDFIAGSDAEGAERTDQSAGAVCNGLTELCAGEARVRGLKAGDLGAIAASPLAAAQDGADGLVLWNAHDGPSGPVALADRPAAQQLVLLVEQGGSG
jgi:hypothetical protein